MLLLKFELFVSDSSITRIFESFHYCFEYYASVLIRINTMRLRYDTILLLQGRCQLGGRAISHHGDVSRCMTRKQWCQATEQTKRVKNSAVQWIHGVRRNTAPSTPAASAHIMKIHLGSLMLPGRTSPLGRVAYARMIKVELLCCRPAKRWAAVGDDSLPLVSK